MWTYNYECDLWYIWFLHDNTHRQFGMQLNTAACIDNLLPIVVFCCVLFFSNFSHFLFLHILYINIYHQYGRECSWTCTTDCLYTKLTVQMLFALLSSVFVVLLALSKSSLGGCAEACLPVASGMWLQVRRNLCILHNIIPHPAVQD